MTGATSPLRALGSEARTFWAATRLSRRLRRASREGIPVVVGPWHSEIGFELLYWIPFLNRALSDHSIPPAQVTAVSRGGADAWYGGIASTYADILDRHSIDDLRGLYAAKQTALAGQKQLRPIPEDHRVLERLLGPQLRSSVLVHPSEMYRLFRGFWAGHLPIDLVERRTLSRPFTVPPPADGLELPDRYVAVKAYFSECFPETPQNREFIARLVAETARLTDVVLLDTGLAVDDHTDVSLGAGGNVMTVRDAMSPRDNLQVQTAIIARAQATVGTYGGFAYLGPFLGVPSVSFYSADTFDHRHLDVMDRAGRSLANQGVDAPFIALRTAAQDCLAAVRQLLVAAAT
jgi:hypothetical protein